MPVVLLATCSELPDLDEDTRTLQKALAERGADARPAVWDGRSVDWAGADLVLVRSTWDYAKQRDAFFAWAESVAAVTELHNPPAVLRWTTVRTAPGGEELLHDLRQRGGGRRPRRHRGTVRDLAGRGLGLREGSGRRWCRPRKPSGSVHLRRYWGLLAVEA